MLGRRHNVNGRFSLAVSLATVWLSGAACTAPTALTQQVEARRLAADLQVQFANAREAGNRAVMAETDDGATSAAGEAEQATQAVLRDVEQLTPLLSSLGYGEERRLLEAFVRQFDAFRTLDAEILALAIENSNLKAQRLSFGPAREAAASVRAAVEAAARTAPPASAARAEAAAARAMVAVADIQVLQAPHIAEPDDEAMTKMEAQMTASESAARRALAELKGLLGSEGASHVAAAGAALDRFHAINVELIRLSRRNSDVRSLALSLGRKRTSAALCEDQLRALQEALGRHEFSATR
jgi:hypothetical protein